MPGEPGLCLCGRPVFDDGLCKACWRLRRAFAGAAVEEERLARLDGFRRTLQEIQALEEPDG